MALVVATVVVAVDQVTKSVAEQELAGGPRHLVGPLSLSLTYNSGSAFSLLSGWTPLVATLAAALVGVLVVMAFRTRRPPVALALGLVIGGALSNLADRLLRGHGGAVVDFIALRFWPTFNLADAAIVLGVATLVVQALRRRPPPEGAHR